VSTNDVDGDGFAGLSPLLSLLGATNFYIGWGLLLLAHTLLLLYNKSTFLVNLKF
jgi:hypothetical protein